MASYAENVPIWWRHHDWEKFDLGCNFEWINTVSLSLTNLGMYDTWLFNGIGFTPNYIKEAVKLRTKDMFIQEWYDNKDGLNRCGLYNAINNDLKVEQHLTDLNFFQRVAMFKFRCRSNYLPISHSRFIDDILVDVDCLCTFCPGQIGDEIHYLIFCPFLWRMATIHLKYSCISKLPRHSPGTKIIEPWKFLWSEQSYSVFISLWKYSNIEMTGIFLSNDNLIAWLLYLYIVKRPCVCIDI